MYSVKRQTIRIGFICVIGMAFQAEAVHSVVTRSKMIDRVLAEEVLDPRVQVSDMAPVIQIAIDRVAAKGGGVVFLSAGYYPIRSRVCIKSGVTLRGDGALESQSLSILCIDVDRGHEDAPATFSIERGSGLKGLTFWYPEQKENQFYAYPWTARSVNMPANDNQTIAECTFVNAWKAIAIGPEGNELHTFRNVRICALKMGISLDSTTDIGRISNVLVSPSVWLESALPNTPSPRYLKNYLRETDTCAVDIGRSDWEYIWRLKIDGYRCGLKFQRGKRGLTNAVMAESDIRACQVAVLTDELNGVGLAVYNSHFSGDCALQTTPAFSSCTQFHSCRFSGALAIQNFNHGANSFFKCQFDHDVGVQSGQFIANYSTFQTLAISNTVGRLRLLECSFKQLIKPNRQTVENDWLVLSNHTSALQTCSVITPSPMVFPCPQGTGLVSVADYGAGEKVQDNADAFQRALNAVAHDGGTVYVPAGLYRFRGNLIVPRGVELRGSRDVPYHTISGGSILMPYHNRGDENGDAFLQLQEKSGVRGLTIWYPEQETLQAVPYPWSIQSRGPACWLVDVVIGNAWQGVDFASFPSDGHRINYLAGGYLRRGLFVGNATSRGWVEDVQFNPHYLLRLDERIQRVSVPSGNSEKIIELQRRQLEGMVFSNCKDEQIRGTFLYAANHGIRFDGNCRAQVLMHGTDTASCGAVLGLSASGHVQFALAQLVPLSPVVQGAVVSLPEHHGCADFQASQFWAGPCTALLNGPGRICMEQFNTLSGPIFVNQGTLDCFLGYFNRAERAHVIYAKSTSGSVVASVYRDGGLSLSAPPTIVQRGSSAYLRTHIGHACVDTNICRDHFLMQMGAFTPDKIATPGGGLRKVSQARCRWEHNCADTEHRDQIVLQGVSDDPTYSFVYCVVNAVSVTVMPDSMLQYWIKPGNENSRATGVDLHFTDNSVLRESRVLDINGNGVAPGVRRGVVGQWMKIEIPLSALAGKIIDRIMVAYDTRKGGGEVSSAFSDIAITTTYSPAVWNLLPEPSGGLIKKGQSISFPQSHDMKIWYTLDGSVPTEQSALYSEPIYVQPREEGFLQFNYSPCTKQGKIGKHSFTSLFEVIK